MTALDDNRLVATFAELRAQGRSTLLPFLTGGYPDMESTLELLKDFESRGVRICEIGFPFSDPIADGATIQVSYTEALHAGVTPEGIFECVRRYRSGGGKLALVAMVSYSIVFRRGPESFLRGARQAGFDGVIVPDLPLEEAAAFEQTAAEAGVANIMLTAPNSTPQRRREIARHARGFLYFMSIAGITGERNELPPATIDAVAELRKEIDIPVCVGFGISSPEMVASVCSAADGAIVGSAIVHRLADQASLPREKMVAAVGQFVGELLAPTL